MRTVFEHPDLHNPLFVKTDHLITSVRVLEGPGHDTVTVFSRGQCTGTLTFNKGEGRIIARSLVGKNAVERADP